MKTQEVTKTVTHYIANDGKDFGEDRAGCELYEFQNIYVKDMERIPQIKNLLFFNERIDGYWCESQEDIDLCCQYFQECKRHENMLNEKKNENLNYLNCLCTGRFLYPGYYMIVKFNSTEIDSYVMYSVAQLQNLWNVFLTQIPINPEAYERLKELNKLNEEFENFVEKNTQTEEKTIDVIEPTKENKESNNIVENIFNEIKEGQNKEPEKIKNKDIQIFNASSFENKENKHDENE